MEHRRQVRTLAYSDVSSASTAGRKPPLAMRAKISELESSSERSVYGVPRVCISQRMTPAEYCKQRAFMAQRDQVQRAMGV